MSNKYIDIVFDAPPGPVSGTFVEVEDQTGESIKVGEWIERSDGYWVLRIPSLRSSDWDDGFKAGWAEASDPDAFVNDVWDAKTPNPHDTPRENDAEEGQ